MKIYVYKDYEVSQFPHFKERPWIPQGDDVLETQNPVEANFIICPTPLHKIKSRSPSLFHRIKSGSPALCIDKSLSAGVETLKYWKEFEHKHVFFDCSDWETSLGGTSAILIRCNVRDFMLTDKNTIPWFWPVEDLVDYTLIPDGGFKYDASFQGWLSTKTRKDSVNSCIKYLENRFDHRTFKDFYGHLSSEEEQKHRRENFLTSQQESKILLAPQSIPGVLPYRFFEAMSSERIPALFCTGYLLPFQNEIDWERCTLRFDAEQAENAGKLIKDFLEKASDQQIIEMGKYGREMWLRWLNRDKQPELVAYALGKRLRG